MFSLQIHYLTLNETASDLEFGQVTLKEYAKFQLSANDGRDKTLNIRNVVGDGTGLIRMQVL
jgi:hypothetical protein